MFPSMPCVSKPHFRAIRSFDSRSREVHFIISKMDAFMELWALVCCLARWGGGFMRISALTLPAGVGD